MSLFPARQAYRRKSGTVYSFPPTVAVLTYGQPPTAAPKQEIRLSGEGKNLRPANAGRGVAAVSRVHKRNEYTVPDFPGTPVTELTNHQLSAGWNMLDSVQGDAVDVGDLVVTGAGSIDDDAVYWWNATTGEFDLVTQFEQGKGYWVVASGDCTVSMTVPV